MLKDPNVVRYVAGVINPLQKQIKEMKAEIEALKKVNNSSVVDTYTCDGCGCSPNVLYLTIKGRLCENCNKKISYSSHDR